MMRQLLPTALLLLRSVVSDAIETQKSLSGSLNEIPQSASLACDYGCDNISVADGELEAYVEGMMKKWHVPGLAIAIIDGNKTWVKVCFSSSRLERCRARQAI